MIDMEMNTTAMSVSGLTNLSAHTGTLGTLLGSTILIGLIIGAIVSAHSWNTKGWLYKLVKWLLTSVGENVVYGIATSTVIGGIYYIGSEISKFEEANPRFLYDAAIFCGQAILAISLLALIGYVTKPIWNFAAAYASGKKERC